MSLYEYELRLKSLPLIQLDRMDDIHRQAWANRIANAEKKVGTGKNATSEYVFKSYDEFFDAAKVEKELSGQKEEITGETKELYGLLKLANYGEEEKYV